MVNKNIQMKEKDSNSWNNLFPLTLQENVFNETGTPLDNVLKDYEHNLNQFNDQMNDLNNEFEIIRRDIIRTVSYNMFREEGMTDEEIIRATHEYANEHNLPVHNPTGEFFLEEGTAIPIRTNVDWGETIFHIDESKAGNKQHFIVERTNEREEITNNINITQLANELKKDVVDLPSLADYAGYLITVRDNTKYEAQRTKGKLWTYEEQFFIHEGGRVEGRISKDFDHITSVHATYGENYFRIVEGGKFILNGKTPQTVEQYRSGGIRIERSRTIIQNMVIEMENPSNDQFGLNGTASSGFYQFYGLYDLTFRNIDTKPRKNFDNNSGTYGMGGDHIVKVKFENITGDGSNNYWGIMGTNKFKKMMVKDCQLNRLDVHWDAQDVFIENSVIGNLAFTGGGMLTIKDSKIFNNSLLVVRYDYGGHWDGDIHIENVEVFPQNEKEHRAIIYFQGEDFDYKTPIKHGRTITLKNITFDFTHTPNASGDVSIATVQSSTHDNGNVPNKLYETLTADNLRVVNNKKVIRILLAIHYPHLLEGYKKGVFTKDESNQKMSIIPNVEYYLSNIESDESSIYFGSSNDSQVTNENEYKIVPKIQINNLKNVTLVNRATPIDLFIKNSHITDINAQSGSLGNNSLSKGFYLNCTFENEDNYKLPYEALKVDGSKWTN